MTKATKQQSNPFSTGGGGPNFETRVQAAFTVLMLSGRVAPCLRPFPIVRLKLQGRYAGYNTDDFIVFTKLPVLGQEAKLFAQIKHDISITAGNQTFAEVIQSAWNDFTGTEFNHVTDAFALVTGPLSATDINNVRPILEWARHCENEEEFLLKVGSTNFSSSEKRAKLDVFRAHLKAANGGTDVSDKQLWEFLKVFHFIGYDLDTEFGGTISLLHSLIALYTNEDAPLVWTRIVDAVQTANQNAGTITHETLPKDIRSTFQMVVSSSWASDMKRLREHGDYILGNIRNTVGGVHVSQSEAATQLIELSESSSFVLVTGVRGCGKSSLITAFSENIADRAPIFCLRTEDLDKPHLDTVLSAMGLKQSLADFEAGFALMPRKYLLVESLEKVLELEHTTAFSDLLQLLNKQHGWTVIATCRDYAYQQVTFQYLQPSGVSFKTLTLDGFSDDQVQRLCEQVEPLQKIANNQTLKLLIKTPFFAELAYRVLVTGTEFTTQDGEKEFRAAVWRDVIAKEHERANGMPLRRKQTFISIAVRRAKQMVYGVPGDEFDGDAVLKLEADNLIRRDVDHNLVSPAHDVLEDWALDQYIERIYQRASSNYTDLLTEIGNEPAMSRAFRLWLHQKLRDGENVNDLIYAILNSQDIPRYWQDETIAAILQGDNPREFLELLKSQLFLKEGELFKRFCFILRIACQTPDETILPTFQKDSVAAFVNSLFLKPYGRGWEAIIFFALKHKEFLLDRLTTHIAALLDDWTSVIQVDESLPVPARAAGLLALHLLGPLKESYNDDGDRKKILSVIIKTSQAIQKEFEELLEADVFRARRGRRRDRPHYADTFCEMIFSTIHSAIVCKHNPDLLIKLAQFEWFVPEQDEEEDPWYSSRIDVAECFGLHEHRYEFFPASGLKGPFRHLLYYHPRKGLDFILDLLNTTADEYAHSDLDARTEHSYLRTGYAEPLIEQAEIRLNDGSTVKQYCSDRLWPAYRGHSVVPYLIESALMALENWLIAYTEQFSSDSVQWLFDYILRKSNSVMPTAVLASVATGFYEKVGKAALPLLRTPELYFLDMHRVIQERAENELNWFGGVHQEALSEVYADERRTAALRPWRREDLEALVVRLQFSEECGEEALAAIDVLRAAESSDENIRFLLHRIDSRGWTPVADYENNRIIFEPSNLEPDLQQIQQVSQEDFQLTNRFLSLNLWAKKTFAGEPLEREYYPSWTEALAEGKELLELLQAGTVSSLASMNFGGIVTAAAVFMRDHSTELAEEDVLWCADLLTSTIMENADAENSQAAVDETDFDGAAAAATTLPILFDFAAGNEDVFFVKHLIAVALTHVNQNVRCSAADGIREYLWQRDRDFAESCINGAIKYAEFEKDHQKERQRIHFLEGEEQDAARSNLKAERDAFREQLARGQLADGFDEITLQAHSPWYILSPSIMIPDGSRKPEHIALLSQMLALFFKVEQEKDKRRSERNNQPEISYKIAINFTKRFAKYLFILYECDFGDYIVQLREGCEIAPSFMKSLLLFVAVEAENEGKIFAYWQFWEALSGKLQEIALNMAQGISNYRVQNDRRDLIRGALKSDIPWQKVDIENQNIAFGKELLLKFATNAGSNPDVFEALTKLMFYFPSIFFERAIHILAKHQKQEGGTRLLSGVNTAFYLERSIQRFLQLVHTGPLPRNMHESCLTLLDAVVETASSRAYYLREHVIHSRKIL